jgi:release factor glutamine methyltransferase
VPDPSVGTALAEATRRLREAGSDTARLDAEVLLAHALDADRTAVLAHPEAPLGPEQEASFRASVERRERGEPVAYIRGIKEFHGMALAVDPRALIPRPESELLVDMGVSRAAALLSGPRWRPGARRYRVADVGTGNGAVAIAFVATLRRRGYGDVLDVLATDSSADALALARENAAAHALADAIRFREADLLPRGEPPFDLVLANLPYVPSGEIAGLPASVSFEPRAAIDGGRDGLAIIGGLVRRLEDATSELAVALIELGPDLRHGMEALVAEALPGWHLSFHDDLAGELRVAELRRAPDEPPRPAARR